MEVEVLEPLLLELSDPVAELVLEVVELCVRVRLAKLLLDTSELPDTLALIVLVFEPTEDRVNLAEELGVLDGSDAEPLGDAVAVFEMVEDLVNTVCVAITVPVY